MRRLRRTRLDQLVRPLNWCSNFGSLQVWSGKFMVTLAVALFLLCIWWSGVFGDAEACPCGPIEECLVVGRSFTSQDIVQKLTGQLIGAYLTWK